MASYRSYKISKMIARTNPKAARDYLVGAPKRDAISRDGYYIQHANEIEKETSKRVSDEGE